MVLLLHGTYLQLGVFPTENGLNWGFVCGGNLCLDEATCHFIPYFPR